MKAERITLQYLKRNPERKKDFAGRLISIWSNEWRAWWRPNGFGYTVCRSEAGVFSFEHAWEISSHAGPEKKLVYVVRGAVPRNST
jgi:hypothetical protein